MARSDVGLNVEVAGGRCAACDGSGHFRIWIGGLVSDAEMHEAVDRAWHPWLYPDRGMWPLIVPVPSANVPRQFVREAKWRLDLAWRALRG